MNDIRAAYAAYLDFKAAPNADRAADKQRIAELEAQLKNAKEHANAASSWLRRGWISKAAEEIEKIGGDA